MAKPGTPEGFLAPRRTKRYGVVVSSKITDLITELRVLLARRGGAEDPALGTLAAHTLELAVLVEEQGNEIAQLKSRLDLRSL